MDTLRMVLPPSDGGLHCGFNDGVYANPGHVGCSRRSTAGSIAATWSC